VRLVAWCQQASILGLRETGQRRPGHKLTGHAYRRGRAGLTAIEPIQRPTSEKFADIWLYLYQLARIAKRRAYQCFI
jgi:DNA-directed RNA polymerase subunit K/omega